jgi:hypothetical protein
MAAEKQFRVRLRLPSSKQETLSLPYPVTIRTLLEAIRPFVEVDTTQIGLKIAYPPKQLDLGSPEEWDREVKQVGISSGEALVVTIEENKPSTPTKQTDVAIPQSVLSQPVPTKMPRFDTLFSESMDERPLKQARRNSPLKRDRGSSVQEEPPEIPVEGGTVVLRIMADDNSCLYSPS